MATRTIETRLKNAHIAWAHNLAAYGAEVVDYRTTARYQIVRWRGDNKHSFISVERAAGEGWGELSSMADTWDCDDSAEAFQAMVERFINA